MKKFQNILHISGLRDTAPYIYLYSSPSKTSASMQVSMSISIPAELAEDLTNLAVATGTSKPLLIVETLKSFVQTEKLQIEKIERGIREADAGNFASDEEIQALDRKWGLSAD